MLMVGTDTRSSQVGSSAGRPAERRSLLLSAPSLPTMSINAAFLQTRHRYGQPTPHQEQTSILGKGFTPQVARPAERVASACFRPAPVAQRRVGKTRAAHPLRACRSRRRARLFLAKSSFCTPRPFGPAPLVARVPRRGLGATAQSDPRRTSAPARRRAPPGGEGQCCRAQGREFESLQALLGTLPNGGFPFVGGAAVDSAGGACAPSLSAR